MSSLSFLSGVRVIDMGQYLPGPHAAQLLGDLGAEVVKVEPPEGEPLRRMGSRIDSDGTTAAYKLLTAGKTAVRVDLKTEAGRRAFESLVALADVLVESYRPGVMERMGLGPERLSAINPRLVHAALTGWGYDGPYASRAGHDLNYMAVGGGLVANGTVEAPHMAFPPVADFASAQQTALAVVSALLGRERSGRGAFLDLSIMETVLGWQGFALTAIGRGEPVPRGQAMLNGGAAFYHVYPTADGRFVTLSAIEPKFWKSFCTAVSRPEWIARQFEPLPQHALIADVAALFASGTMAHWQATVDPADCCFEAVPELSELAGHPHLAARGQIHVDTTVPDEPLVHTAMGLRVDGGPPPTRARYVDGDIADVLARWERRST
jgi:crotonobetainyl-CoA:carnitine CoA-transferase CaiB-like acyl-CoA transferase